MGEGVKGWLARSHKWVGLGGRLGLRGEGEEEGEGEG